MSNLNPSQLTAWIGSIDIANDLVMVWKNSNSTLYKATPNQLANLTSQWVGRTDTQTLTNKTLTAPTISSPVLSGTVTGTYTLGGTPTFPAAVVTLTGSQTLTNKILTSPTINAPTITNATLSADAITGFSSANNGTLYGISVAGSVITGVGTVGANANVTNGVQAAALATNAITLGYAQITSSFTSTTVAAYVDVTSLAVTITVPPGGRNLKITTVLPVNTTAAAGNGVVVAVREGSTTLGQSIITQPVSGYSLNGTTIAYVPAPSPGSHTYKTSVSQGGAGTITVTAGPANPAYNAFGPAFILVEAI